MATKFYKEEVDCNRVERTEMRREMYCVRDRLDFALYELYGVKERVSSLERENFFIKRIVFLLIIGYCILIGFIIRLYLD